MPGKSTWVERRQRRHDSRFFRLLDNSFLFRLVVAASGALALLFVVNSYATCRNNHWAVGCLRRDMEALVSVNNVEALSIVTAALLYVLEGDKRRQRENLEAYDLLMRCHGTGLKWLIGRIHALESLNRAGLPIDGQQLAGCDLHNLQAPNGHWHGVNLENTVLRNANLAGTDLRSSNLRGADLGNADLRLADLSATDLGGANLRGADLRQAVLIEADLRGADLRGALLEGSLLAGAQLDGVQLDRAHLRGADLGGAELPTFGPPAADR